jgi:hypothetical protein
MSIETFTPDQLPIMADNSERSIEVCIIDENGEITTAFYDFTRKEWEWYENYLKPRTGSRWVWYYVPVDYKTLFKKS